MSEAMTHAPGTFCWVELGTSDAAAAKKFYTNLFGWDAQDMPAGEWTYTMLKRGGKDVGGLYQFGPEQKMPTNWTSYVAVQSADDCARQAESLRGTLVQPPMDVMDVGRMAVVQDPTGAVFAVWQPKKHPGAGNVGAPGFFCWNELMTRDTKAARGFYTGLFGWGADEMDMGPMKYTIFKQGERQIAGMMPISEEMGPVPPHWLVYFAVEDCDASVSEAGKLGGQVLVPSTDIPNIGRFSVLQDPQGGVFAVIRLSA